MQHIAGVRPTLAAGLLILCSAGSVTAQACLGTPAGPGQYAIGGLVGFTDGATSYSGGFAANVAGPFAFRLDGGVTTYDAFEPNSVGFAADVGYELPVTGVSVCPRAGFGYSRLSETVNSVTGSLSQFTVPIGMGLGKTFHGENQEFGVTLYAVPSFLYIRVSGSLSEGGASLSATESYSEFGTVLGTILNFSSFFVGGGVTITTLEGSDPQFGVGFGFLIGPGR